MHLTITWSLAFHRSYLFECTCAYFATLLISLLENLVLSLCVQIAIFFEYIVHKHTWISIALLSLSAFECVHTLQLCRFLYWRVWCWHCALWGSSVLTLRACLVSLVLSMVFGECGVGVNMLIKFSELKEVISKLLIFFCVFGSSTLGV